ncbi:MAG: glycosyltransferase, partial [Kiritimatiellae bacterium]|nr:glycosyltransferase [Kiritimatiellia bacterium]
MTILVVHDRYRVRGGEDAVFETECRLLEEAGNKVVRYVKDNRDILDRGGRLGLALCTVWNPRTYREVREIIRCEKPDAMHCHNTFPLISPSVCWAAAREGVPVVQTLHNYRLACLNGYLFRDGKVCEKCLGRTPWCGLRRRCYRGSFGGSLALFAMLVVHRVLGTWRRKVAHYIALTDFARRKFELAGLPAGKLVVKPNAFAPEPVVSSLKSHVSSRICDLRPATCDAAEGGRVVYIGRLSPEKGVDILVRAWALLRGFSGGASRPAPSLRGLPPQAGGGVVDGTGDTGGIDGTGGIGEQYFLTIIGEGSEESSLRSLAASLGIASSVSFLGALPRDEALAGLSSASLLVFPSLWYEQFAITPLEAMALGVPVLVSDVARGATIVEDGVSGRFFPAGDPAALAAALRDLLADPAALR